MPKTKTIVVDEILPPDKGRASSNEGHHKKKTKTPNGSTADPFSKLGWKAKFTLWVTQTFLILRNKSYGKWIIGPVVILVVLLAIPLAFLAMFAFFILALFRPIFK